MYHGLSCGDCEKTSLLNKGRQFVACHHIARVRQSTTSDICVRADQRIGPTGMLCRLLGLGLWLGLGSDESVAIFCRTHD